MGEGKIVTPGWGGRGGRQSRSDGFSDGPCALLLPGAGCYPHNQAMVTITVYCLLRHLAGAAKSLIYKAIRQEQDLRSVYGGRKHNPLCLLGRITLNDRTGDVLRIVARHGLGLDQPTLLSRICDRRKEVRQGF